MDSTFGTPSVESAGHGELRARLHVKGTASIFAAPLAAYVMLKTGSWVPVFYVMIACDIIAAFMALRLLKPLAKRTIAQQDLLEKKAEPERTLVHA